MITNKNAELVELEASILPPKVEVVVVGGSIAGAAAARASALAGREVLLLESRARPNEKRLAGEMMHPRGAQALARLGLLPGLLSRGATRIRGFATWESPEAGGLTLDYPAAPRADLPDYGVSLHHHELVGSLLFGAVSTDGVIAAQGRVTGVLWDGDRVVGVRVGQGEVEVEVRADLVVAADGRHSSLRKHFGLTHQLAQPSMSIGVAIPASALPHPDRGHVFLGAWGPCLAYPVGREDARVVIDAPVGTRPGRDLAATLLREHLFVFPPRLRAAVADGIQRGRLRFAANHHLVVPRIHVPGGVLIGDANGIVHPLTAAGMTLSLFDAEQLATALRGPGAIRDADLERFARQRERFAWARTALCDALYEVFSGRDAETRTLQRAVFAQWRQSPSARARTMRLLACADSSPLTFLDQYLRVLGRAARQPGPGVRELLWSSGRRLGRQLPSDPQGWLRLAGPSLS